MNLEKRTQLFIFLPLLVALLMLSKVFYNQYMDAETTAHQSKSILAHKRLQLAIQQFKASTQTPSSQNSSLHIASSYVDAKGVLLDKSATSLPRFVDLDQPISSPIIDKKLYLQVSQPAKQGYKVSIFPIESLVDELSTTLDIHAELSTNPKSGMNFPLAAPSLYLNVSENQNELPWEVIIAIFMLVVCAIQWFFLKKQLFEGIEVLNQNIHPQYDNLQDFTHKMPNKEFKDLAIGVFQLKSDVEKKRNNLRRLVSELKSDKLQLSKDQNLLRVLCHDIATPAAIIQAANELGRQKILNPDPSTQKMMDKISRNSIILGKILDHVREMMAVESGKIQLELKAVHLSEVILHAKQIFEDRLKQKDIKLDVNKTCNHISFLADETSFTHNVFNNILSNAIKFSPPGGVIHIEALEDPSWQIIKIIDHGQGIPSKIISQIFQPDSTTTRVGTSGEKGTGFGLPVAKTYMTYFGGNIRVLSTQNNENEDGRTVFILYLQKHKTIIDSAKTHHPNPIEANNKSIRNIF